MFDKIIIYYKDGITMRGEGISKITEDEEEITLENLVEIIQENCEISDIYNCSLYIGADMAGYSLNVDYSTDVVPDDSVDKINDYLFYYPIEFKQEVV